MQQLNAQQNLEQGAAWAAYAAALHDYATARADDPTFDDVRSQRWRDDAAQISKQYYLTAIDVAYDDANDAFAQLQSVTNEATADVARLAAAVNSWNRFADVASAMAGLVLALGPPPSPLKILAAAKAVAKVV